MCTTKLRLKTEKSEKYIFSGVDHVEQSDKSVCRMVDSEKGSC